MASWNPWNNGSSAGFGQGLFGGQTFSPLPESQWGNFQTPGIAEGLQQDPLWGGG